MSKPDKTLDPKILDAAKKEFLEKGGVSERLYQKRQDVRRRKETRA